MQPYHKSFAAVVMLDCKHGDHSTMTSPCQYKTNCIQSPSLNAVGNAYVELNCGCVPLAFSKSMQRHDDVHNAPEQKG